MNPGEAGTGCGPPSGMVWNGLQEAGRWDMTALAQIPLGTTFWLRVLARGVVVVWALFWIWFNVMSAFGELGTDGLGGTLGHLGLAAVVLATGVLAWRWEGVGGLALLLLAAAMVWVFRGMSWQTAMLLVGPPVLAGLSLLVRELIEWLARSY